MLPYVPLLTWWHRHCCALTTDARGRSGRAERLASILGGHARTEELRAAASSSTAALVELAAQEGGSLEEIEKKCDEIEENDDLYNDKQIMKNNDELFKQLEEQDVKINELKDIVKYLSVEKKRKDKVNNKCRENNQNKLNENYSLLKKLNDDGLARDNQIQLDLNVSDTLKSNIGAIKNTLNKNTYNKKCSKPPKNSTNIDKIKLDDKCHGCVNSKIKNNYNHIKKDFKY